MFDNDVLELTNNCSFKDVEEIILITGINQIVCSVVLNEKGTNETE